MTESGTGICTEPVTLYRVHVGKEPDHYGFAQTRHPTAFWWAPVSYMEFAERRHAEDAAALLLRAKGVVAVWVEEVVKPGSHP